MMRMYGRPFPAGLIYPDALFSVKSAGRKLYLTFDDGPDPDATPFVLDVLKKYGIRATFFCTGSRVTSSPALFARIAAEGHATGNHGYSHLNGLKTPVRKYCADIMRGREVTCSNLFRPPYGRLRRRQYKILERSMRIVFWDVMPYDFDNTLDPSASLAALKRRLRPGSVIVLHDTSGSHALSYLEQFIKSALSLGYSFAVLDDKAAGHDYSTMKY